MVSLCHDALIVSLSVLAGGSGIRGTSAWAHGQRTYPSTGHNSSTSSPACWSGLLSFSFRDVLDLEVPHAVPQLEVGPLARQLVTGDLAIKNHRACCTVCGPSWTRSCSALPPPLTHSGEAAERRLATAHQRLPRTIAPDFPQPTSSASSSDGPW